MRRSYWSNSNLANWIRGTAKPNSETSEGWRSWNRLARTTHPVRYWIAEEALDRIQNFIYWPTDQLYAIKYYINNRWVTRTHALTAHPRDIRPGTWQDVGYRFLPCLFNELVDYVEIELAWFHIAWDNEAAAKYRAPFWSRGWWRWRTWRCAEAGIDNLHWQIGLKVDYVDEDHADWGKPTPQAERAREILDLYNWWTQIRPQRVDSMITSGWSDYCERRRLADPDDWLLSKDQEDTTGMLEQMNRIDAEFDQEDEDMLIRLIKVRHALWT